MHIPAGDFHDRDIQLFLLDFVSGSWFRYPHSYPQIDLVGANVHNGQRNLALISQPIRIHRTPGDTKTNPEDGSNDTEADQVK